MTEHVLPAAASVAPGQAAPASAKMGRLAMASSIGTTLEWYDFTVYNIMAAL
ncbi:MAG: MFS transporter, partial [Variovorax sp.]